MLTLCYYCLATVAISGGDIFTLDIVDGAYRNACGPICCYVSLRSLGFEASLPRLADECGWRDGETVAFSTLYTAFLSHDEVTCSPARLTPAQIGQVLQSRPSVIIIPVRAGSEDINHAVCVVGANDLGVLICDYPEMTIFKTYAELGRLWDGEALVVRRSGRGWLRQNWAWLALPISAAVFAGFAIVAGRASSSVANRSGCEAQSPASLETIS